MPWPAPHSFGNERLWLDALLEREILRLRARYSLSLDELRGLYISDRQVDELLRRHAEHHAAAGAPGPRDPIAALTTTAAQWRAHFDADSPLDVLGQRLQLDADDLELVFVAFAPELDLRYETLYAYLNNDVARKAATLDMARRLLDGGGPASHGAAVRARAKKLVAAGVLGASDADERRSSLGQSLVVTRAVSDFLLGVAPVPTGDARSGRSAGIHLEAIAADDDPVATRNELIVCRGDDAEGQARWVTQYLAARGRHALHCTPDALTAAPLDSSATLLARLAGAALVLHEPPSPSRDPAACERLAGALQRLTDAGHTLLWLVPRDWQAAAALAQLPLTAIDLPAPDARERAALWSDAIRAIGVPSAPPGEIDALARRFAARFSFGAERIELAVRRARVLLEAGAADAHGALERSARQLGAQSLAQVAQWATRPHTWEQLVLPATTRQVLREVASAIGTREQVYREWNMQGRTGRSAGLTVLFAGASGTGKTMAASVLANHVGLELFRIDLAGVISKYIGETEKNLDRIFTAARDADAILLFDEADALLGKRSEVKDAHDRYANIEVAYLLQKMEEHDGVVILASNLPKNLDQAFARRMHYVVEFARPNASLREQLWRGMFPLAVPLGDDIDYAFVAEEFDLTGGDIQTIALEAAFLAAGDGGTVGMAQLMRALARRQTKHGDPGVAARFRAHLDVVERGRA